jgi:glycosyltransferase involved in cell wall biosynthesis
MSPSDRRGPDPEVSVVVPSHGRLLRLRWLLNALELQTLERERFEIVLVHDYGDAQAAAMIDSHPLAGEGVLRPVRIAPEQARASRQRNLGWRAARAPVVAFVDDDCRPDPAWLAELLAVATARPGAIVQGTVAGDPLEAEVFLRPLVRTLWVDPPDPRAQTANILYPRALLEAVGGFDESLLVGEDMDLCLRCRRAGAALVAAPRAVAFHAVEAFTLPGWSRVNRKWRDLPLMLKAQPRLRRYKPLGVFWTWRHVRAWAATAGVLIGAARAQALLAALPYLWLDVVSRRGFSPKPLVIALSEAPRVMAGDAIELAWFARGSVRHRSLLL